MLPVTCVLRPILQASCKLPTGLDLGCHPQPQERSNDRVTVCTWTSYDIWNSYFGSGQSSGRFRQVRAIPATYGLALRCYALRSLQLARPQPPHLLHRPEAPVAAKHAFQEKMQRKKHIASHCYTLLVEDFTKISAVFSCKLASVAIFSARKPFG